MKTVLALDIGSSAVRAALYDLRGRAVRASAARREYAMRTAADGTSETDADGLIRVTERCLADAAKAAPGEIIAAGVSTFWHGLVAADEEGRALTPLYLWSDTRAAEAAERLRSRPGAEAARQRTGCPLHASYWPAKLEWLRGERPDLWRRRTRWLSFGDLLFQRLFGRVGTSLSIASGTGLFTLEGAGWDNELLRALHVDAEALPPIAEVERGLARRYRRAFPALADVPWFHAAGDGALANLGSGCTSPRRRSVTIGTSAAVRVMHRAPIRAPVPAGLWRYRLDARRLVTGAALSSGGNVRDWVVRTLGLDDGALEKDLRRRPPGGHGLTALPHIAGERSPGYAAHAFGAVAGLTLATTAMDVARAAIEAVTIEVARVNRLLDAAAPRAAVLVASGGALLESPGWMQMLADATHTPVAAGRAREASLRGAALFALERLGLAESAQLDPGASRTFRPRRGTAPAFADAEARQVALYRALISKPGEVDGPA